MDIKFRYFINACLVLLLTYFFRLNLDKKESRPTAFFTSVIVSSLFNNTFTELRLFIVFTVSTISAQHNPKNMT